MPHLEHSFVWCRKMDTSESGSETIEVLKCGSDEEWKDQLERPCEKQRRITKSEGGNECPTQNKTIKADWIGHNLRGNYLIKRVTEGKGREDEEEDGSSY